MLIVYTYVVLTSRAILYRKAAHIGAGFVLPILQ